MSYVIWYVAYVVVTVQGKKEKWNGTQVLDDRDVDKIEEDRRELNTKKEHGMGHVRLKRPVRGLEFQWTTVQLCSKECSVRRLCRRFGELYFSAEKHYEW